MSLCRRMLIIFSAVMIGLTAYTILSMGGQKLENDGLFTDVAIEGVISVDGGEYRAFDPGERFDLDQNHTYRIRGHFTREIEKNHQIMLRISDLLVHIWIDGRKVFSFGDGTEHSAGNVWQYFTSPGITPESTVEIELYNIYTGVHPLSVNQFLSEIHYGSVDGLYKTAFRENGAALLVGFLIFVIGICEGVVAAAMILIRQDGVSRVYCSAGFAVFSGIWFCIQFNVISLIIPYPRAVATADVLSPYLMTAFFALYLSTYLSGRLRILGWIDSTVPLLYAGNCIARILFEGLDAYRTISSGWTIAVLVLLTSLLWLWLEYLKNYQKEIRILGLSLIPILIGTLLDAYGYWSGTANDTMWLRSCFLLFVLIQMASLMWQLKENMKKGEQIQKLENELIRSRISVMLNQIQPHFIYNALNTIKYLCDIHAENAGEVVASFARYLRGNLDSMAGRELIPFPQELDHLKNYLTIEQLRFPEVLVMYDLKTMEFCLPPLTLQPLVENAIRYGFAGRETGGNVTVSTSESETVWTLKISDNGLGFDPEDEKRDGKSHIGIVNTRERVEMLCKGTMRIDSVIGKGTEVTIVIPKENEQG